MTSSKFVWVWLPGQSDPVVCGRVWRDRETHLFVYGKSYRERPDAVPLYGLPISDRPLAPPPGMRLHGALRDGLPDAWGQHVILARLTGRSGVDGDTGDLDDLTYMHESGSDRFGAIDFQDDPAHYAPRQHSATLDDLAEAASALEDGRPLPPALDAALNHGTTIGGARPKATLVAGDGSGWIAKFSSSSDRARPAVKYEHLALELARRIGVDTVEAELALAGGRDALLVRRFDRGPGGTRRMAVSGLTMLELDEMFARHGSYPILVDKLRASSDHPADIGPELFTRIATNIAIGNTDDHARNHAALWDGHKLELAPAYDLDPCRSPGWDANQAMAYGRNGERASNFADLISCSSVYDLTRAEGSSIVDHVVSTVEATWAEAVERSGLTTTQGEALLGSRVLNDGIMDGLATLTVKPASSAEPTSIEPGNTWVQPHYRGGHPVAGHWRRRSSSAK